jgi:hypothetical protein
MKNAGMVSIVLRLVVRRIWTLEDEEAANVTYSNGSRDSHDSSIKSHTCPGELHDEHPTNASHARSDVA